MIVQLITTRLISDLIYNLPKMCLGIEFIEFIGLRNLTDFITKTPITNHQKKLLRPIRVWSLKFFFKKFFRDAIKEDRVLRRDEMGLARKDAELSMRYALVQFYSMLFADDVFVTSDD